MSRLLYLPILLSSCSYLVVLSDPCNVVPVVTRTVQNEGFHRDLVYDVELNETSMESCTLVIMETLSESFYVNKDQLADLARFNKVFTYVESDVDIEAPEWVSEPHNVSIYSRFKVTSSGVLSASVSLPIHVRYHRPQEGGGYYKAFFNQPKLFVHCPRIMECIELNLLLSPCFPGDEGFCRFSELPTAFEAEQYVYVPVGNSDHQLVVTTITFLVTIFGCIYTLKVLATINLKDKKNK